MGEVQKRCVRVGRMGRRVVVWCLGGVACVYLGLEGRMGMRVETKQGE